MKKTFGAWTVEVPEDDNTEREYIIECAMTGDVFEDELTHAEAEALVRAYEAEDRKNGEYTEGFYAIRATSNY